MTQRTRDTCGGIGLGLLLAFVIAAVLNVIL
jgi:hypothetical protein